MYFNFFCNSFTKGLKCKAIMSPSGISFARVETTCNNRVKYLATFSTWRTELHEFSLR